jgi:hypothetical protein
MSRERRQRVDENEGAGRNLYIVARRGNNGECEPITDLKEAIAKLAI